jgi:mRNA interferase RelE/StbE
VAQYRLEVKNKAIKELAKIRPEIGVKLLSSIESLASTPRPRQSRKMHLSKNSYRLKSGDYRVLYQIDDDARLITVYHVGHRRDVYRE